MSLNNFFLLQHGKIFCDEMLKNFCRGVLTTAELMNLMNCTAILMTGINIGKVENMLTVVYTERDDRIRIISEHLGNVRTRVISALAR